LLTRPLSLGTYLENWKEVGFDVPDYEIVSLLSDLDFDKFMLSLEEAGGTAVVDPIFEANGPPRIVSGFPIASVESISNTIDRRV
jgi:hypothetical protein